MTIVIAHATISAGEHDETRRVHVVIRGETIEEILPGDDPVPAADEVIDADGLLLLPGGIDPHVHFDTPGYTSREDFTSASMNAAAGGTTTVIDMPETCVPTVTTQANLRAKQAALAKLPVVDYALWGGVSANSIREEWWHDEMRAMWESGVVAFKIYMISGMDSFGALSFIEMGQVLTHAATFGALVGVHAEDRDLIEERTAELVAAGEDSLEAYYESRADPAEKNGVAAAVRLALTAGARVHIVHVASRLAAAQVMAARQGGLDATMESCPHYLAFTTDDFERYGSVLKCAPVIKRAEDRDALWRLLGGGEIDFVATDHAACEPAEKDTGSVWSDYGGLPGVAWRIPFLYSEGVRKHRLSLGRFVDATATAAAKRFGLHPKKGAIAVGSDADCVLFDPARSWTVTGERFGTHGHLTPFAGRTFTGAVMKTFVRGRCVFDADEGILVEPGYGQFQRRTV